MLQHLDLMRIDIIDDILLEAITEMNGDTSNPTKRLEDPLHLPILKPLPQVNRNGLWDNRIPTLLINLNTLLKPREQIVPFIEIPIQLLPNIIPFLEFQRTVIVLSEFEIFLMDLEVGADLEAVVILTQHLMGWELIDTDLRQLHERKRLGESIFNYYKKCDNDFFRKGRESSMRLGSFFRGQGLGVDSLGWLSTEDRRGSMRLFRMGESLSNPESLCLL